MLNATLEYHVAKLHTLFYILMIDFKEKWGLLNIFGSFFFASNKSTMTNYVL